MHFLTLSSFIFSSLLASLASCNTGELAAPAKVVARASSVTYKATTGFSAPASNTPFLILDNGNSYSLRPDGNFVVTSANGSQLWTSGTGSHSCVAGDAKSCSLDFGKDGTLVLSISGQQLWTSKTARKSIMGMPKFVDLTTVTRGGDLIFGGPYSYFTVTSATGYTLFQAGPSGAQSLSTSGGLKSRKNSRKAVQF